MAPIVPVRAASSCHLFHDVFWFVATWEEDAAAEAALVEADAEAAEPMRAGREVETLDRTFHIEEMFWYCEKAP
jgi:hypothetical protein